MGVGNLATGPSGSYIVIPDGDEFPWVSHGISDAVSRKLHEKDPITAAFSGAHEYYLGFKDGTGFFNVHADLEALLRKDDGAKWLSFGPDQGYIYEGYNGQVRWWNIPSGLSALLEEKGVSELKPVGLGRDGAYFASFGDGTFHWMGLPANLDNMLRSMKVDEGTDITSVDRVWLSAYDDRYYLQYNGGAGKWSGFNTYFDSMMLCDKMLNPLNVYYTQDSIGAHFNDGKSIYDMARDLNSGVLGVTDLPTIEVLKNNGDYFSKNNRRLWAFRNSGVTSVPVKVIKGILKNGTDPFKRDKIYIRYRRH